MPFQPCPNIAQVDMVMMLAGQRIENVLHFIKGAGWDESSLGQLCARIVTWWPANYAAPLSQALSLILVEAKDLSTDGGAQASQSPTSGNTGGQGPDHLPGNVCICLTLKTATGGRSGRGRVYVSGFAKNAGQGNQIEVAAVNALKSGFFALLDSPDAPEDEAWVVLSRRHNKVIRPQGVGFPITNVAAFDYNVDSQRRRLTGRGK